MSEVQKPLNPDLFNLMVDTVEVAVDRIQRLKQDGKYITPYLNWLEISFWGNGMPYFNELWISSCPPDYKSVFRKGKDSLLNPDDLPTFQALLNYVPPQAILKDHLKAEDGNLSIVFRDQLFLSTLSLIDCYLHTYQEAPFSVEKLLSLYLPIEVGLFAEKLHVNVVVPIILLNFGFDEVRLGDNAAIIRMSEDFQLSRAMVGNFDRSNHSRVSSAATHALVLTGYELDNDNWLMVRTTLSSVAAFPMQDIDAFFSGVRIVTGYATGYAQLLFSNNGWAHQYTAHLPPLAGDSTRRYATEFENNVLEDIPTVTSEQAVEIGRIFEKLRASVGNNQLGIASRRLNLCYLRETEEDAILDATIGLESLLLGGEHTEITHKLALRMAALSTLDQACESDPTKVFRDIKDIYAFRSRVAHGSEKPKKKREIAIKSGQTIPTVQVAIDYLRVALALLLAHPQYLKASRIDEELLLAKLSPKTQNLTPLPSK